MQFVVVAATDRNRELVADLAPQRAWLGKAQMDEFVFRWNWRRHYRSAFDLLLGIGLKSAPMDYWALIGRPSPNVIV
jgi:hypothetical protein